LLLGDKAGESLKEATNGGRFDGYCGVFQVNVVSGVCVMEEFRLVFVSLGTLGIISYLVYVALSEDPFNRRR
jgi:hypothetical protein